MFAVIINNVPTIRNLDNLYCTETTLVAFFTNTGTYKLLTIFSTRWLQFVLTIFIWYIK